MVEIQGTQRYEVVSWDKVYELLIELAKRVTDSGFAPKTIVGISRGGLIPARILSDLLDNPNLTSISVKYYSNINKKMREPIITQPISIPIEGKILLLVDDVADTGKSLHLAYRILFDKAKEIRTLTLFYKPWSCLKPDFYAIETSAWIIFPWELHETIKLLINKYMKQGRSLNTIMLELKEVGFDPFIVKRFVRDFWNLKM